MAARSAVRRRGAASSGSAGRPRETPRDTNDSPPVTSRPKSPGVSWRDHLCLLLEVGSEIEHTLMVEYLYAAWSLGGEQVPPEHRASVARWQNTMLTIAREEMGHLVTVQNLRTLVGAPVNFARSDYPFDTPYYPFPFRLSPLTMDSVARYVYAEKPPKLPAHARPSEVRVAERATKRVEKEVEHPHPVYEVYEKIIEVVQDTTRIPDSTFDPTTYARQASFAEWGKGYRPEVGVTNPVLAEERKAHEVTDDIPWTERRATVIVAQMATRTEALQGLLAIAAQGEAPHLAGRFAPRDGKEPSHFERFVDVYEGFERVKGWCPVRDVPVNPTTRTDGPKDSRTVIEAKTSRVWAELFNLRYRMALTWLTHVFRVAADTGPGRRLRGLVLHRIFGEMYNMKTIGQILMRSPLTDDPDDKRRAGPPFEMPYTLALPTTDVDCWRLHQELLRISLGLGKALGREASADAARYLATLASLDAQGVEWIDQVVAGLGAGRNGGRS